MIIHEQRPICFVTASAPFSSYGEAFAQDEVTAIIRQGAAAVIVPARLRARRPNDAAQQDELQLHVEARALLAPSVLARSALVATRHPRRTAAAIWEVVRTSGSWRSLVTNLLVIPKALWLSALVQRRSIHHIHAYWFAHTATLAMLASRISGVAWSSTAYRWDIDAENCAPSKLQSAAFVRTADELGVRQLEALNTRLRTRCPIHLVRTGVEVPADSALATQRDATTFCCPGAFVPKKAQALTAHAFARVIARNPSARLVFYGDGKELPAVRTEVVRLGIAQAVDFQPSVPLNELRQILRRRPTTVLASIRTSTGEQEGIPVTLVEAMANGSPVISTPTGSIATLLAGGCGVLVEPGDPEALAAAMLRMIESTTETDEMTALAYSKISTEFNIEHTAQQVYQMCSGT